MTISQESAFSRETRTTNFRVTDVADRPSPYSSTGRMYRPESVHVLWEHTNEQPEWAATWTIRGTKVNKNGQTGQQPDDERGSYRGIARAEIDRANLPDFVREALLASYPGDGEAVARRVAQWEIGDPDWADVILDAYRDPRRAEQRLRDEGMAL